MLKYIFLSMILGITSLSHAADKVKKPPIPNKAVRDRVIRMQEEFLDREDQMQDLDQEEATVQKKKVVAQDEISQLFNRLDADHNKKLSREEFDLVNQVRKEQNKKPKSKEELDQFFKTMDRNKDGWVTIREFRANYVQKK